MFNFFGEVKEKIKNPNKFKFDAFNVINISGHMIYAEGHTGLVGLSKEQISFKVKGGIIVVQGSDMFLEELSENTIKICGNIKKVEQV